MLTINWLYKRGHTQQNKIVLSWKCYCFVLQRTPSHMVDIIKLCVCFQKRNSTGSHISAMLWRRTWIIWSSVHVPAAAVQAARHDPIPFHDTPPRVMAAPAHPASTLTVSEHLRTHPTDRWEHTRLPTPVMPAHTRLESRAAARSTAWMKMVGETHTD